jgi:hypothetical protein
MKSPDATPSWPDSKRQRTNITESSGTPSLENVIEWGVVGYV